MAAFEVEIVSATTGLPVGFGPVITAQFWDDEAKLDAAGAVSFDMPRADPRSDLVAERQTVRCSTLRGGQWAEIGRGVVEDLTEDMQPDQTPLLEVGASDSLIALADRTVGNLKLSTGTTGEAPMAAANLLAAVMAFAPAGWTVVGVPSEDVYLAFAGESVLAALGKLASQLGDHFRLDSGLTLTWLPKTTPPVASGIRAMSPIPNPTAIGSDRCLITHLQRKRDASKQASRVYAYGGGNNDARVTLSSSSTSYVAPTYVLPAGYSYGTDGIGAYIKHDAADAANRIDAIQTFQDVAAVSTATGHAASATNALAQTAVTWLARHVDVYYSYDLEVTAVSQAILPGQTIRVVHDQFLAGRRIAVVDADLLVLGVKKRLDPEGTARVVSLTVASSDRWPEDDDHMVAGNAIRTQSQSSHLQVASRAKTAENVVSPTFSAGSIPFVDSTGAYAEDNADLFWDDTNNRLGIGTNAPVAPLHAVLTDAATTTAVRVARLGHNTSGTAAAGFGSTLEFGLQDSTTPSTNAARIIVTWATATHGSQKGRLVLHAYDASSSREGLRVESDGTQALTSVYGVPAVARQTVAGSRSGGTALTNLLTALAAWGVIVDGSTA